MWIIQGFMFLEDRELRRILLLAAPCQSADRKEQTGHGRSKHEARRSSSEVGGGTGPHDTRIGMDRSIAPGAFSSRHEPAAERLGIGQFPDSDLD